MANEAAPAQDTQESEYKHVNPNFQAADSEPAQGLDAILDEVEGKPKKPAQSGKQPPKGGNLKSDSGKPADLGKAPPAQDKPELFEIKVNGKTQRLTRDELIARAQLSESATSRFEEAAQARKQVEKIISTARSNPIEALMDPALGLSKDQIRDAFEKWYAQEYIDPETLTPEQLRLRDSEAELKAYKDREREAKEKAEQEEQEKLTHQQTENLQKTIVEAMESSGLPKTKFFVSRMAFYMRQNLLNGWEAPTSVIIAQVRKERQEIMSDLTESSDPETLIALLGDGVVNKIRQHDLKKLREKRAPSFQPSTPREESETEEKVDYAEVKRAMRKQWGV